MFVKKRVHENKLRNEMNELNFVKAKSCAALYGSFGVGWLCNVPKGKWYFTHEVSNANRRHIIFTFCIA